MGCKVLFGFVILAAISALGSSCLDCDCLQTQRPTPTVPTLGIPNIAQILYQLKQQQRMVLQNLLNTGTNTLNSAINYKAGVINSGLDLKQQVLNPLSVEGALSPSNIISTKKSLLNSLIPNISGGKSSNGQTSPICNCIPKSPARKICKKPMPKLYLPKPTFTYVINATNLPQMYQKNPKPRKQLVKCVQTVKTYVQQEEDEEENCEYDTDNIQYEFIDDGENQDNVKVNVIKGSNYDLTVPDDEKDTEDTLVDSVDENSDDNDDDDDVDNDNNDDDEENQFDDDLLDEEYDVDVVATTVTPVPQPAKRKGKNIKNFESCECDDDYDIKIKVLKPKSMRNRKYCKCRT